MSLCEYLDFLMLTEIIGGSELTVPAQAAVMMFALPSLLPDETITTGTGLRIVETPTATLSCLATSVIPPWI